MSERLERLAALTRGAAIVTLGVGAGVVTGCSRTDPTPPPTVATAGGADTAADSGDAGSTEAGAGRRYRRFPIPNAIHRWPPRDAGPGDSGGDGSSGP
jgi:hypothetical protein